MLSSFSPRTKLCHESIAQASCRLLPPFMTRASAAKVSQRKRRRVSAATVWGDSGVLNFDKDLICALQARVEGFELADIENVVSEFGIFLSPKLDRVKGCRPSFNDRNMRVSDVKFGGKRSRVCDVVDKGCVFALRALTCARQSCMEHSERRVWDRHLCLLRWRFQHHLFRAYEEEEKQCERRTL